MQLFDLTIDDALTHDETSRLTELEERINTGLRTFVDVGNALLEIRDSRLYRQEFSTFEHYCRERWGMSRFYAHRMIEAASVADNLLPIGNIPATESQARPLTKLEPEQQREAWQRAVETAPNGKVTAAHVQGIADEYRTSTPVELDDDLDLEEISNGCWNCTHRMTVYDGDDIWVCKVLESRVDQWHMEGSPCDMDDWQSEEESKPDVEPEPVPQTNGKMAVHFSSESPEHYTPKGIINAVQEVMGGIDLDPCSNGYDDAANVPAHLHYTTNDDGLSLAWHGRVYMNPPYGREIGAWVSKLVSEYQQGNVTEAIALVPGRIDTEWYRELTAASRIVCHVAGRLTFIGNNDPAPFPSVVAYLGDNDGDFYEVFKFVGEMWQRVTDDLIGV